MESNRELLEKFEKGQATINSLRKESGLPSIIDPKADKHLKTMKSDNKQG
jgi:hypothetical protein